MADFGILNFVKAANDLVKAKQTSMEGLERYLEAWFCTKFNTTLNDPRLEAMTLEELLVTYYIFKLHTNPDAVADIISDPEEDSYEKWLREEMADEYVSDEEMVEGMLKYEENQKLKRKTRDEELKLKLGELPDRITTDFANLKAQE
jgi:hypothetical protein